MKKILLVILGMFLLGFALNEIAGVKFPIGSTMLHDTSASVLTINKNVKINGYMESKGRKIETGQVTKQKVIRGALPTTTNTFNSYAHGVADYRKIIAVNWLITDDSLGISVLPGYNSTAGLTTGNIVFTDGTNLRYYLPTNSVNLKSDTIKFFVTYTE